LWHLTLVILQDFMFPDPLSPVDPNSYSKDETYGRKYFAELYCLMPVFQMDEFLAMEDKAVAYAKNNTNELWQAKPWSDVLESGIRSGLDNLLSHQQHMLNRLCSTVDLQEHKREVKADVGEIKAEIALVRNEITAMQNRVLNIEAQQQKTNQLLEQILYKTTLSKAPSSNFTSSSPGVELAPANTNKVEKATSTVTALVGSESHTTEEPIFTTADLEIITQSKLSSKLL